MTRSALLLCFVLAAGGGLAQDVFHSSETTAPVPTFMNAEIVRVDTLSRTITFRSESGDAALTAEGSALTGLAGWHAGDKVIVGYRTAIDSQGRQIRIVTELRPTSPTSGTPRTAQASSTSSTTRVVRVSNTSPVTRARSVRSVRRLRVMQVDRKANRLTVADASGRRGVIRVQGPAALTTLGRVRPGDVVSVTLTTPGTATTRTTTVITEIQTLPANTVLDQGLFSPVSGQLVRVDAGNSTITLHTSQGEQTFAVAPQVAAAMGGLTSGQDVTVSFGGTADQTAASTGASMFSPSGRVISGRVVLGPTTATTVAPTGMTQNLGVVPLVTTIETPPMVTSASAPASVTTSVAPAAPKVVVTPNVPGTSGPVATVNNTGTNYSTGPYVPSVVGPVGVLGATVNSAPGTTATVNVAVPPAVAKAPQSAEEVGTMRAEAVRDLDGAAVALALRANEIDAMWAAFKNQCLTGATPGSTGGREWFVLSEGRIPAPSDDGCRALFNDVNRCAQRFREQMGTIEDAARQADVRPGTVREVWQRHRLDH